ncbi:MAG: S46 family peptidase [Gemmataceae bacterium]
MIRVRESCWADEGMYLFTNPPRALLKAKYGFDIDDAWLERLQKASVRFNNGGSGSFVSPHGLVLTNHHIGSDALQKLSSKDKDYLRDGFHARNRDEELRCPDLELNVLQSIEDVTHRVNAAVKPTMSPAEAFAARRAVIADIEKESLEKTGLRSDVVTLYNGGLYHLYRYQKYTDVRLVFAPEQEIAFFGGDTDNFEYPRHNLDVCFFRVYENDKPAKIEHYLKWSETGPQEGELVFVSGHPGTTNRLETLARLRHRRDITLPYLLQRLRMREALLLQFSERGPEFARMARTDLHRTANARKAYSGMYQGLLDPAILGRKAQEEVQLQAKVQADPAKRQAYGNAWQRIAEAQDKLYAFETEYALLELGDAFDSQLFRIARHLVRLAAEKEKPNAERLPEYRETSLDSLYLSLFSPAPIHPELERAKLGGSLSFWAENLGGDYPLFKEICGNQSPAERAAALVNGSKLADVAERRQLAEGGTKAIAASTDPMIQLARQVDDEARQLRKRYETEVEEPERQAYGQIAQARFDLLGTDIPPDATFTLRLAFGVVQGYEVDGETLPFHTTFGGAFERAEQQQHREPFVLPQRWRAGQAKLDPATPFNFVSTADTIGGNSGSPVVNRNGELVGVNFDRNRHGLVRNFVYTDVQARHISVHSRGILEALRRLYGAEELAREVTGDKH